MTTTEVERPPAEAAEPTIDPRIQERRTEVTRARHRRHLRAAMVVAACIVAVGLGVLTLYSPFLDADHIPVTGARRLSAEQVRRAAGIQRGDALWFVDAAAAARGVERLPWVREATVERDFPDTVRLHVQEYDPVAYVRVDAEGRRQRSDRRGAERGVDPENEFVLIADDGRAIARAATPPVGTTEIVGVRRAPEVRELLSPPEAANVVAHVPAELAAHVVAIDVGAVGLALRLADDDVTRGGTIRLGGADDLRAKFAAALAVLSANGGEPFAYIDVSTPSMPTVMDTSARRR